MTRARLLTIALLAVAFDILCVILDGTASPLALGRAVGTSGFLLRLLLLGALFAWRMRLVAPERRPNPGFLVLALLLLPTLAEFQLAGGRLGGDGVMYYVYVRSLAKDADVDLTNEYTHYGLITRGDLSVTTKTGLRRSIFAVGPAVVELPFFTLGEVAARAQAALSTEPVDLSGYGPHHRNAVALGSLLYGWLAVVLVHDLLRRHFRASTALAAALLLYGATFLYWYMVQQPAMSHAPSTFGAALSLWLWERGRGGRTWRGYLLLGLVMGLAMCIRWQNGVLLVLPGFELLGRLRREPRAWRTWVGAGALMVAAALVGAFPQMWTWKKLYDMWVLPYPPHGTDFVRLDHPWVLQTLFSSRHGLLAWTPVLALGFLGFLPLLRTRRSLALPLLPPLLLMTYVNMCSGDWWAGGSFSNRRFDSLLPLLACGMAAGVDVIRRAIARHPRAVVALFAMPLVLANVLLAEEVRRGVIPRDDTVAFPRLVGLGWRILADAVGSPSTWPASWIFAARENRPPGQYDALVGRYLFYRQNNMGGHIEVGVPGDEAMLGEGWGGITAVDGRGCRPVVGRARVFAPLDVAEDLEVRVRAYGPGAAVGVAVGGREAGQAWVGPGWSEPRLRVDAAFWKRELNSVWLTTTAPVCVDAVVFAKVGR